MSESTFNNWSTSFWETISGGINRRTRSAVQLINIFRVKQSCTTDLPSMDNSMPCNKPLPRTSFMSGTRFFSSSSPFFRYDPTVWTLSKSWLSNITRITARPAAQAKGFPPKVENQRYGKSTWNTWFLEWLRPGMAHLITLATIHARVYLPWGQNITGAKKQPLWSL